jgi:hypothetical protein
LVICPYDPIRYAISHSTVVSESLAHGIPVVVPANTVLSRFVEAYGGAGLAFSDPDPVTIQATVQDAIGNFDILARRADAAALQWKRQNGPGPCVDAMLRLAAR